MNILIVEDEPEMARLLMGGLREESYEVRLAKDGCAALELSAIESFDIILLDLKLPKVDGLEVARKIRRRKREIAGFILKGGAALPGIVEGGGSRVDAYLGKRVSVVGRLVRSRWV